MTGADLRRIRIQRHMTQRQISKTTGIDPARLCRIEKGNADKMLKGFETILNAYGFTVVRTLPEETAWSDFEE